MQLLSILITLLRCSEIVCGADRPDQYIPLLSGKKVGLVVNASSRAGGKHLLDYLVARHIRVQAVFAPEHGFRSDKDAGELVSNSVDAATGVSVISLYGAHAMPSDADLRPLDVILFDLQDVGVRFYTYLSTLHYVMKSCAINHKPLILLDRPNPNGNFIGGPVLDTVHCRSFVGLHPVPISYGMTIGEYAGMINGENWLSGGLRAELTVIPLTGYTHQLTYHLPVAPSPNLSSDFAISAYPSLCLFEGTVVSVGRGTDSPFVLIGHPLSSGTSAFKPRSISGKSKHPPYENQWCRGDDVSKAGDSIKSALPRVSLYYLIKFYNELKGKVTFFNSYFEKLSGAPDLKGQIEQGVSEKDIRKSWESALDKFKKIRQRYLLYP